MDRAVGGQRDTTPTITRVGSALVVTLPRELDDVALHGLRLDLLERVRRARVRWVVFEASGLELVDADEFAQLSTVARSASWLGARTALVGLSAGLVGYLVDEGVDTSAFRAYAGLDEALAAIGAASETATASGVRTGP